MKWSDLTLEQARIVRKWFDDEIVVTTAFVEYKFHANLLLESRSVGMDAWYSHNFAGLSEGWMKDFKSIWDVLNKKK